MGAEQHEFKTLEAHNAVSERVHLVNVLRLLTLDQIQVEGYALPQLLDLLKHRKKFVVRHKQIIIIKALTFPLPLSE
jgi:hypothetical protein